uniref:Cytochrome b5 heme-binding domain-containing protein n=1 Tax=Palpitomonas bilix TaxID=652834 RepID=A0A7S3G4S3_9EUKA|mmetsp:Transcript_2905/g.5712  ORF Transcript_2905/g.5712 Transcript_2905/m.5712 type:complete len:152 (+) Transcript_2905:76-531(+)|eukprot:CAMPEP_0113875260 /NCGR_PEP_ID=MMETSP0780_2-20120614/4845_1 /TAXON_ID=652834 /ORGANISM="Palpitomonas bilix" /LENGTH=151 /DNA_ID=CAMNT_0000861233 /DNA_START=35 /DNA_END=490 /DNA_ORIENTATION=- /assembly_acc=CAM_ASM_000599
MSAAESGSFERKPKITVQNEDGNVIRPSTSNLPRGERNQVPLMPGYSLQGWVMKKVDARQGAPLRPISKREVREHKTLDDCWIIFEGNVYDISSYMHYHPGGTDKLMLAAGRDATPLFRKYHAWVNGKALIEKCKLGPLLVEHEESVAEEE